MSRKALSVTEAKVTLSERSREVERGEPVLRVVEPQGGLASIAGGWEGSDELVEILADTRRTIGREDLELGPD